MTGATNILDDLLQAIYLAKADIVLAENLDGKLGFLQKRRAIDLLMSFKPRIDAATLAIGREIYQVEQPKNVVKEKRGKYRAQPFTVAHTPARGLSDMPGNMNNR